MKRSDTPRQAHQALIKKKRCRVLSVYDGDTLTVEWTTSAWLGLKRQVRHEKIRLAYINTPELRYQQPGAIQAKEFLAQQLTGRRVILEYAQLPNGQPRTCEFQRILAVVHRERTFLPNVNINEALLKKGLARMFNHADNITPHHRKQFERAERTAQRRAIGIWQERQSESLTSASHFWYYLAFTLVGIIIGIFLATP